jgi:hypothetical protein
MLQKQNNFPSAVVIDIPQYDSSCSSDSDDEPSQYETQTRTMTLSMVNSIAALRTDFNQLNTKILDRLALPQNKKLDDALRVLQDSNDQMYAEMIKMHEKLDTVVDNTRPKLVHPTTTSTLVCPKKKVLSKKTTAF